MAALVRRYRRQLRLAIAGLGDAACVGTRRNPRRFDVGDEPNVLETPKR
jgi:hypothetical protein